MATRTKTSKKSRVKLNVNKEFILIDNNLVEISSISNERNVPMNMMATIVSNLAYYGFVLSKEAFDALATLDKDSVKEWWSRLEPSLKEYTGDSKNMSKYVVYKNFPFAALQWGEEPQKGNLFEPSRAQLSFPLEGDSLTKYIAYIDIKERKLVYMDANLRGSVKSAIYNLSSLAETMPAFEEYLNTLPSVYDMLKGVDRKNGKIKVAYDDADLELKDSEPAYIFKPVNDENSFTQINLQEILSS